MKPRYKRRLFWSIIATVAAMALAVVIVPPFISLYHLKPKIENAIVAQTGIPAQINGDVNFSLLGGTTIVAHNVSTDFGTIDSVMFSVPIANIFNLADAPLTRDIFIYGARLNISSLTPPQISNNIEIYDCVIRFQNKDYYITHGILTGGMLRGTVRTDEYKYEFDSNGDEFHIRNHANNLDVSGRLYSDGSAHGTLSIDTNNINKWFEFSEPRIPGRIRLAMEFDWNGEYGLKFSNIQGDNFTGNIELLDDGRRMIELNARDLKFDISFLLNGTNIFYDTALNLDLYGDLTFAGKHMKHVKIDAIGTKSKIQINNIIADDMSIGGGTITANGAENMPISLIFNGMNAYCLFSGNPENWKCSEFKYGNLWGSLSVNKNTFEIFVQSDEKMPDTSELMTHVKLLASRGKINFQFADVGGAIEVIKTKTIPTYKFAKNKTLNWLNAEIKFLPKSMYDAVGDFAWGDNGLTFTPHDGRWTLSVNNGAFYISGKNAKDWFADLDLRSLNDQEYTVSGNFKDNNISNLEIKIGGHVFRGSVVGNKITLTTDLLNIDSFVSQYFLDNYEEQQFLTGAPLLIPFAANVGVSLSADTMIYNGDRFTNFVYSLKENIQTFSITDSLRGNLLASITKSQNKYDIELQLNRFVISDKLLISTMPFNISETIITGVAKLSTSGQIAFDIWHNINGPIDISFDGGILYGLGVDDFYANTDSITTLNAEYVLSGALDSGYSRIKNMHIVGDYDGGNFITTAPFTISMRHSDARGTMQTLDGKMSVNMDLILRGTSPEPAPISIEVLPNGKRNYSLSQIMIGFDPDFLREFKATHDKF